jgi:ankyrin repeat protein
VGANPPHLQFLIDGDAQRSKLATMIHVAASKGHSQLLEVLLEQNSSLVDEPDSTGYTPLQKALEYSQIKSAEILLAK